MHALVLTLQAADASKPKADKQLNFQFYRNPAAILADSNQQVGIHYEPGGRQAAAQSVSQGARALEALLTCTCSTSWRPGPGVGNQHLQRLCSLANSAGH